VFGAAASTGEDVAIMPLFFVARNGDKDTLVAVEEHNQRQQRAGNRAEGPGGGLRGNRAGEPGVGAGYLRSRLWDWESADDLAQDVIVFSFKSPSVEEFAITATSTKRVDCFQWPTSSSMW